MEKLKFYKDDVICYQGDVSDGLYILIEGEVEILIADEDLSPDTKKSDILSKSRRISVISESKAPFGEISCILNAPRNATIKALTDTLIIKIPAGKDSLKSLLHSNPTIGFSITKNLLQKTLSTFGIIENTVALLKRVQMYYDNYCYIYYKVNPNAEKKDKDVYINGKELHDKAHSGENAIADKLTLAFIETNMSNVYGKEYGFDITIPEINSEIIDLIKCIFSGR